MNIRSVFALSFLAFACKPQSSTPPAVEEEKPVDEAPLTYERHFRFVNLGPEAVILQFEGKEPQTVAARGIAHELAHVVQQREKGTITARNFAEDGTATTVTFPFEYDVTVEPQVTIVLKETMPSRISMNVTTTRQTQGSSFGERVKAGLAGVDVGGPIDLEGDCAADLGIGSAPSTVVRFRNDNTCDDDNAAWFRKPNGVSETATPYFMRGEGGELEIYWLEDLPKSGMLPGAGIVSAAVSSMYVLNAHGGGSASALKISGNPLFQGSGANGTMQKVAPSTLSTILAQESAMNPFVRAKRDLTVEVGGGMQTIALGAETGPCRPPYLCDFMYGQDILVIVGETSSVMKSRHETAKNSVGNIRGRIVFQPTTGTGVTGCALTSGTDKDCAMGFAGPNGQIFPPEARGGVQKLFLTLTDGGANSFTWSNSPVGDQTASGYAVFAKGEVTGGSVDQRTLFFVKTSVTPWTLSSALSN